MPSKDHVVKTFPQHGTTGRWWSLSVPSESFSSLCGCILDRDSGNPCSFSLGLLSHKVFLLCLVLLR